MKIKTDSLESPRLRMEIRQGFHAAELFDPLQDQELYRFIVRDAPTSVTQLAAGFTSLESIQSPDGLELMFGWVGREKVSDHPVGVFEVTLSGGEAFIAYTVFRPFWGQGFASEACQAMMSYITKAHEVRRFVIEMDTRNRSSTRVAEKLGFRFVKVIENVTFLKNIVSHEFQFEKVL